MFIRGIVWMQKWINTLLDVKIYPFEMMDAMYSYDMDILIETEPTHQKIIQKISDLVPLEKEDYDYLESLSTAEMIQIIRKYDANIVAFSEYIHHTTRPDPTRPDQTRP